MDFAKRLVKVFWIFSLVVVLSIIAIFFLTDRGFFGSLPNLYEIKNPAPKLATEIYSSDGVLLGKLYHKYDRINIAYHEISPYVSQALVATEDERFFKHAGLDFFSLFRAVLFFGGDGGGSTITQQLAKNMFTENSARGFKRIFQKLKEWIIAIKLERNFSKEEILTMYLNTVPFGDNIYGIRNASITFFQKQPLNLRVEEAAVLIGLLKSNTTYNPRINPEKALQRRNVVLYQMVKNESLTKEKYDSTKSLPIKLNYLKLDEKEGVGTYFREYIRTQLRGWIDRYAQQYKKRYSMYQDGLKVYTTINSKLQYYLERSVQNHLTKMQGIFDSQIRPIEKEYWKSLDSFLVVWKRKSPRYASLKEAGLSEEEIDKSFRKKTSMSIFTWKDGGTLVDTMMSPLDSIKHSKKMLQVGALFVNPNDGRILAWVGGINYKAFQYDHVKVAKRQVGSTIKPLLYALAMESYGFTPQTLCSNTSQCFPTSQENKLWCTQNNPGSRTDSVTSFAEGIVFSLNNVSAFVLRQVSPQNFAQFLHDKLKISDKIYAYPSLALGTSEFSLFEMIRAYTVFPTNGVITNLQAITRIEDKEGRVIQYFPSPEKNIVLSEETAYKMSQIMQGTTTYGTARKIKNVYDIRGEISGKTGTTNDFSDAWFIGFSPTILGGVWVGCEDKIISFLSREGEGSGMALPIFGEFMAKYIQNSKYGEPQFRVPLGVNKSEIKNFVGTVSKMGAIALLNKQGIDTNASSTILFSFRGQKKPDSSRSPHNLTNESIDKMIQQEEDEQKKKKKVL